MNVPITCRRCTELIIDFVGEELDAEGKRQFESHLSECQVCLTLVTTYRLTITKVRDLPPKPMPAGLLERLRQAAAQ